MITRQKAVILIVGEKCRRNSVLKILTNHEALVQINSIDQITRVWDKNKTPVVSEEDFEDFRENYTDFLLIFNVDQLENETQEYVSERFTKYCYNRKIEPGEYKVKNTAKNSSKDCFFCDITHHPGLTTYEHNLQCKLVDTIIYESPNFCVVPGLGPLAPGYLMIMTKDHYLSLAQIPENLMEEYLEVEKDMVSILKTIYGQDVGIYEHGTGPNGAVGLKSIVHMHIHLMLDNILKNEYKAMMSMKQIDDIKLAEQESYFWYKNSVTGDQWIVFDPEVYIPRQVHRQIYAEEHGFANQQFNWRKTPFSEITEKNVYQLYQFLKEETCTDRIIERTVAFVKASQRRFEL